MKKIICVLFVLSCLATTSCSYIIDFDTDKITQTLEDKLVPDDKVVPDDNPVNEDKQTQDNKSVNENKEAQEDKNVQADNPEQTSKPDSSVVENAPRTVNLSDGISEDGLSFSGSYDFDYDGVKEDISMSVYLAPGDDWNGSDITVNAGAYSCKLEMIGGMLEAVYACDIDNGDGLADLAIITRELSDDPRVRILKYNAAMDLYPFYNESMGKTENDHWLGYAVSFYFNVNDDGSITMEEQTNSSGMWSVYRTFSRDGLGVFREVKQDKYDILPDFMEKSYFVDPNNTTNAPSGEELTMWKKGYIKAHTSYTNNGFTISEGEYFKVLQDNDKNMIYVEKEDGSAAWISIDYNSTFPREALNEAFFYLAG